MVKRLSGSLTSFIERRPLLIIILMVVITASLAPGLTSLKQEVGFDTLISPDKQIFKDTDYYTERFGHENHVILLECHESDGGFEQLLSFETLTVLDDLEHQMLEMHENEIHSIISPVTILKLAQEEARKQNADFQWNDQEFINMVLYYQEDDPLNQDGSNTINPQLSPLLIDRSHINGFQYLIANVIPVGGLDHEESIRLVRDIESYLTEAEDDCRLINIDTSVMGLVEITEEVNTFMAENLTKLLMYSIAVMAVILLLMFRVRWNLLSLIMVGLAAVWTFGLLGYAGIPLSASSMAVLPILIGLGIDYAIQFHNRYQEELVLHGSVSEAMHASILQMLPVVFIAMVATVIGFITLFISEVPSVQDFGKQLAIGVVFAS